MRLARILRQLRPYMAFPVVLFVVVLGASPCLAQDAPAGQSAGTPALQDLNKYSGLLNEGTHLFERFQRDIQFPPPRSESRLLPLLPESTFGYGAFPNYGDAAHQALTVFRQELEESSVLRDWWRRGDMAPAGPKMEDSVEKFYELSQFLGDEVAVSVLKGGREPGVLVIAEVRKPGLKNYLDRMLSDLGGKAKLPVRILEPKDLAAPADGPSKQDFFVLVRPDFLVLAPELAALRTFNAQLDSGGREFASTPFGRRVAQAYSGGLTTVVAADVHEILSLIPPRNQQDQMTFQQSGFADMKYFVSKRRTAAGRRVNESELSFNGPRHGAASWLAAPAPMNSLDFVSPRPIFVATLMLKDPAQIFDDVRELAGASHLDSFAGLSFLEQALKVSLRDDVLGQLGGEITLELDTLPPPDPVWKAILRVQDAGRLQQTLAALIAAAHLPVEHSDDGGVTYYAVRVPSQKKILTIGYAFVDGYLVIGSSRQAVAEAVRIHKSGDSLGKSDVFLAALPPGHPEGASALFYEDLAALVAMQLQQAAPDVAGAISRLVGGSAPVVGCAYGEETTIRMASTSGTLDAGVVLMAAAVAVPNLLRSKIAANEASAVGTVRTVNTAQVTYAASYPQRGFAPDLATLGPDPRPAAAASPDHANLLDETLGNSGCTANSWCAKSGYNFRIAAACRRQSCKDYVVVATPVSTSTGNRNFCSVADGLIRFQAGPPLDSPVSAAECKSWPALE